MRNKKCLIIHGSVRKGNTYKVTQIVREYIKDKGKENIDIEEVFLGKMDFSFCVSCHQCLLVGEHRCPHYKVIKPLVKKIEEVDALILTSPVYSRQLSALVKCFIDHISYFFHRPQFFVKKAMVIATATAKGSKETTNYMAELLRNWGFNYVEKVPIFCHSLKYKPDFKEVKFIEKKAENFYKEIFSGKSYKPGFKRLVYFNTWRALISSNKTDKKADYKYWQETKMLDKPYNDNIPLGFFKKTFGEIIFRIFKRIINNK